MHSRDTVVHVLLCGIGEFPAVPHNFSAVSCGHCPFCLLCCVCSCPLCIPEVSSSRHFVLVILFKKKNPYLRVWLLIFREKGRGWGERTKHQSVASCYAPRQLMEPCRLGVCPDRGSNPEPFRAQHSAPTTRAAGQGVTHS